ncbi:MAG: hypothetical protein RSD69_02245, partial [Bacilli bacterium]
MYSLFYNKNVIGDVLLISFENESIPNRKEADNNIVRIYKDDRLIGINIFNISLATFISLSSSLAFPQSSSCASISITASIDVLLCCTFLS